jgi:hypothetical protein
VIAARPVPIAPDFRDSHARKAAPPRECGGAA